MTERPTGLDQHLRERLWRIEEKVQEVLRIYRLLRERFQADVEALAAGRESNDDDSRYFTLDERERKYRADRAALQKEAAAMLADVFHDLTQASWEHSDLGTSESYSAMETFHLPLGRGFRLRLYHGRMYPVRDRGRQYATERWNLSLDEANVPSNDNAGSTEEAFAYEDVPKDNADFLMGTRVNFETTTDRMNIDDLAPKGILAGFKKARFERALKEFKRTHGL
ncbi:hypothetical protein K2Y00_02395 [Patescibacteria group bacterium]|nr:hypothetical protein [Patescibacteria group bacterium]